jgi:tetratricopeptide (TPR) repeat protein
MLVNQIIASAAQASGGGGIPRAERMLRSALEHQPDNATAHVHLALCLEALQRPEEATLMVLRGLRKESSNAALLNLACLMLRRLRNLAAAEIIARRLFALPDCPPPYLFNLIDVLAGADRPDEAADAARQACERHPDDHALSARLGQLSQR